MDNVTQRIWELWQQEPYKLPLVYQWRLLRVGRVVRFQSGFEQVWLDELCLPTGKGQEIIVLRGEGTFRSMSVCNGRTVFPTTGRAGYSPIEAYALPVEATNDGLLWMRERSYIRPLVTVQSQLQPISPAEARIAGPWLAQAVASHPGHPVYETASQWLQMANPMPVAEAPGK